MSKSTSRRRFIAAAALGVGALTLLTTAGCGGSSGSGGSTNVSAATRARVQSLHGESVRGLINSGAQTEAWAQARNGGFAGPAALGVPLTPEGSGDAIVGSSIGAMPLPLIGAFIRNVAAVPPDTRRARRVARRAAQTSPAAPPVAGTSPPVEPPVFENPAFFFDYYLGLWVQVEETAARSTYTLFEDEAKTKPAGSIETDFPADWETFPQTFRSTYTFTAGYLAGSRGSYLTLTNADYSGRSTYENVYAGASSGSDRGESRWSGRGDYSWSSRSEFADAAWAEARGSFRSDGSGGTRTQTSDGYAADYTYFANGAGRGTITGPGPGLPATITWDSYGNTTIRYADGSVETIPGYGFYGGGAGGIAEPAASSVPR